MLVTWPGVKRQLQGSVHFRLRAAASKDFSDWFPGRGMLKGRRWRGGAGRGLKEGGISAQNTSQGSGQHGTTPAINRQTQAGAEDMEHERTQRQQGGRVQGRGAEVGLPTGRVREGEHRVEREWQEKGEEGRDGEQGASVWPTRQGQSR